MVVGLDTQWAYNESLIIVPSPWLSAHVDFLWAVAES